MRSANIRINVFDDDTNIGIDVSLSFMFSEENSEFGGMMNDMDMSFSVDKLKAYFSFINRLDQALAQQLVNRLLQWAYMLSVVRDARDGEVITVINIIENIVYNYETAEPCSAVEFILEPLSTALVRALVARGLLNIAEVFAALSDSDREKIAEDIFEVRLAARYDNRGNIVEWRTKKMVYISYRLWIDSLNTSFTGVRCICPSTGQTHWLLVPERLADRPRAAVAWTCMVPRALHERGCYVIKRQGDIFIFDLTEDLSNEELKEIYESELIHHPADTFWKRYVDEA